MKSLPPHVMTNADRRRFKINDYVVTNLPVDTSYEDLLQPSFWAHFVSKDSPMLKKNDEVTVIDPLGAFRVTLWVYETGPGYAKVRPLYLWRDERARDEKPDEEREARDKFSKLGTPKKFPCVTFNRVTQWSVLGYEGAVVKDKITRKSEADKLLREYERRTQMEPA